MITWWVTSRLLEQLTSTRLATNLLAGVLTSEAFCISHKSEILLRAECKNDPIVEAQPKARNSLRPRKFLTSYVRVFTLITCLTIVGQVG